MHALQYCSCAVDTGLWLLQRRMFITCSVCVYVYYIGYFTYVCTYYRGTVVLHRSVFYSYVNVLRKSTYAAGV